MLRYQSFIDHLEAVSAFSAGDASHMAELFAQTNEPLDQIISKLGLMSEQDMQHHLSEFTNIEYSSEITPTPDSLASNNFNIAFIEHHRILPLEENEDTLEVALVDPLDKTGLDGLAFATGKKIKPVLTTHRQWEHHFATLNTQLPPSTEANPLANDISADAARLMDLASTEPVIKLVNKLIAQASDKRASDIHIEPGPRETSIRFRIDGTLHLQEKLSNTQCLSVISRIKILAELDIAERRRPQDGRLSFPIAGRAIDLRVSTIPTDHGESAVLRLLDQTTVALDFTALGYQPAVTDTVRRILNKPHGILLVTGPTGSGKTTTLYTFLQELVTGDRKILTIEDPIEYRLEGISQSQVNPQIDVTFASALRSFLRHDPDVMMVGEIRDFETANIAIQAALTGHLVLSTLHTNDAASAITRLRDLGVENYLIASTIIGSIGQRLVRRICGHCENDPLCKACNGTGYAGRIAVTEVLEIETNLQRIIREGESEQDITDAASGFISMRQDGLTKASQGLVTQEDVMRILASTEAHDA